jgi:UDP-N-acetylmuramoyl-L-alanyl-D-glutamate--2,6-diaminopimelate ligase
MQKLLTEFTNNIKIIQTLNKDKNPTVNSLEFDSRKVKIGTLFFALPGTHVHGNMFIKKAIEEGASAVIYQDDIPEDAIALATEKKVPLLQVENTHFAMSPVAADFYNNPSSKMKIIGVTGTEGKSTTVFLVWQLLRSLGKRAGFFSTVQYSLGDEAINNPEHQTTPEATIVQFQLYEMLKNGCECAVIEASSHGLSKKTNRLGNVLFDAVAMMNVTHEHLEFHGTHEQYKSDKANLFRALDTHNHIKTIENCSNFTGEALVVPSFGVVNLEDPSAEYFIQSTKQQVFGFTTNGEAGASSKGLTTDTTSGICESTSESCKTNTSNSINSNPVSTWQGNKITSDNRGENFTFTGPDTVTQSKKNILQPDLRINLPGTFNVYNTMAAILLVAGILQISTKTVTAHLEELIPVKGRMTLIEQGQPFEVMVDYAHTPSSFRTIFPPLRKQLTNGGRLMCLFGSGGERDVQKRPEQGKIAAQYCDVIFLCDEDPRKEEPIDVVEDIAAGCEDSKTAELRKQTIIGSDALIRDKTLFLITDRSSAIQKMFSIAKKGDIVLLLGKAHENSIIYKDFTLPYDEISEAQKTLEKMGYKK